MSIPKDPRQLMINLMYLVLTALLALNVSAEVMNAFKVIDDSLVKSNTITNKAVDEQQSNLDALLGEKSKEKFKPLGVAVKDIRSEITCLEKNLNLFVEVVETKEFSFSFLTGNDLDEDEEKDSSDQPGESGWDKFTLWAGKLSRRAHVTDFAGELRHELEPTVVEETGDGRRGAWAHAAHRRYGGNSEEELREVEGAGVMTGEEGGAGCQGQSCEAEDPSYEFFRLLKRGQR